MLRRIVLALSVMLVILGALMAPKLMNGRAASAVAEQPIAQPTTSPDRVEVQQQIVKAVEATPVRRAERPAATIARRAVLKQNPAGPITFMQRAARTLVGDGRHRPEPFPRAR